MDYKTVTSKVFFLKMQQKPAPVFTNKPNTFIQKIEEEISIDEYRKLYLSVGENLNWLDRIFMEDTKLNQIINSPKTHIYTFNITNTYAGYCELVKEEDYVEILYFGLIPGFIGKGYGNYFLQKTIEIAWSHSPKWIQLNTCDLDHPNALGTYKKAGFKLDKTIEEYKKVKSL